VHDLAATYHSDPARQLKGAHAMRTMYDSITARDIPLTAAVVLGYVNGTFEWSSADWDRFPHAVKVRCATRATVDDGHVLDVEQGDATPAQAPGWVQMRRRAGLATPTVYCSASAWPSVKAAFTAAGVAAPLYLIAHYDGDPAIPAGAIGKQYRDPPNSGGHWDLSVVADHWPGVDPTPPAPEDDMLLTDKLDPNAAPGTVNEALNAVLGGLVNVRQAGPLALNTANGLHAINAVAAQLSALTGTLTTNQAALLGAITTGEQHVDVDLTPDQLAAITTPITAGLAALPAAVRVALGQALVAG
jgi:hypothetical protein